MPRPHRIEFAGAWYHVMNRGIDRGDVFLGDGDRRSFLDELARLDEEFRIECHACCLMNNHYHLLLHTVDGGLGAGMTQLGRGYVRGFNDRHGRDGPLFRNRYTAILVDDDSYLLEVSRYIHLNPVKAGLCQKPGDWAWSSAAAYTSERTRPAWLHTGEILGRFDRQAPRQGYKKFLSEGVDATTADFYKSKRRRSVFGSRLFIETFTGRKP